MSEDEQFLFALNDADTPETPCEENSGVECEAYLTRIGELEEKFHSQTLLCTQLYRKLEAQAEKSSALEAKLQKIGLGKKTYAKKSRQNFTRRKTSKHSSKTVSKRNQTPPQTHVNYTHTHETNVDLNASDTNIEDNSLFS